MTRSRALALDHVPTPSPLVVRSFGLWARRLDRAVQTIWVIAPSAICGPDAEGPRSSTRKGRRGKVRRLFARAPEGLRGCEEKSQDSSGGRILTRRSPDRQTVVPPGVG